MRFTERKEFVYDPEVFRLRDTQVALSMYAEWVRVTSPRPYPKFFETDRDTTKIDDLWHVPLTERTTFSRTLDIPAIASFEKPDWRLTKLGITPLQRFKFTLAALHLHPLDESAKKEKNPIRLNYFPLRGDMIYYMGYRLMIINVVLEPAAYWQQTNVWMGLVCEASIAPDGDAKPIPNLGVTAPAEEPGTPPMADWPGFPPTGPTNTPHDFP
jgi:hypothetical protein